ncbi:hypothetical protein ACFQVA_24120 [Actinomadura keratinilytica]
MLSARRTNLALRRGKGELERSLAEARGEIGRLHLRQQEMGARHAHDVADVRADAESATKAVLKSAMGTLQSLAEEQQLLLDGLLKKYGNDAEVLGDLMSVDHTGSQFSRRAKGISVLCGGWLGRRDGTATVYDVARSAQGRIKDFGRVSVHSQVNVAVTSKAVEPVAVVLAELLENATNYSAPGTPSRSTSRPSPAASASSWTTPVSAWTRRRRTARPPCWRATAPSTSRASGTRPGSDSPSAACSPPATASPSRSGRCPPTEVCAR